MSFKEHIELIKAYNLWDFTKKCTREKYQYQRQTAAESKSLENKTLELHFLRNIVVDGLTSQSSLSFVIEVLADFTKNTWKKVEEYSI